LLDSFRKGQRWLSLIFVSVIGLVFVFFLGVGGGSGPGTPSGNVIVQLDDTKLTSRDFEREKAKLEARLRQELGDAFDKVEASNYIIGSQALGKLTNSLVLAAAAKDMGLHTTQDELRRVVQGSPIFIDEEGRFSPEAFDRFAAYEYGSQRAFIQNFTRDMLGQKLIQLIIGQTVVSDAEIDLRTRYELEVAHIAYVVIDSATTGVAGSESVALEDSEVEAYSDEHEDELRSLFDERSGEYEEPERVRARHILALVAANAPDNDVASAREQIESALARVNAGEDFARVARELSEDIGTKEDGGDLGLFTRGDNDPALEEAAFALESGEVSEVVQSSYGFHILRVDERVPAKTARFESKRTMLAREVLTRMRAEERAEALSTRLAEAIKAGDSLEVAAREEGLSIERPGGLKRRSDGFIPGLGAATNVLTTVFTLEAGETSPEIFELADRRVLVQVLERSPPSAETLANERTLRRERAQAEKENRTLQAWINDYRSQLEASGRLMVNAELALGS
jgi:peptidyl-prolyl cis-trans isomerase D